jgi:RHS repeat-associated protein
MACAPALREGSPPEKVPYREKIGPYLVIKEFDEEGGGKICEIELDLAISGLDLEYGDDIYCAIAFEDPDHREEVLSFSSTSTTASLSKVLRYAESRVITTFRLYSENLIPAIQYGVFSDNNEVLQTIDSGERFKISLSEEASVLTSGMDTPNEWGLFETLAPVQNEGLLGIQAYHFGVRMYDPVVGVFTSTDPLEEFHNLYSYTGANPINLIDPVGLSTDFYVDDDDNVRYINEAEDEYDETVVYREYYDEYGNWHRKEIVRIEGFDYGVDQGSYFDRIDGDYSIGLMDADGNFSSAEVIDNNLARFTGDATTARNGLEALDGEFTWRGVTADAKSGPWRAGARSAGGALQSGMYTAHTFWTSRENESYQDAFDLGWSLHLDPNFTPDPFRRYLRIHPDGGANNGTAGCIGLDYYNSLRMYNAIEDYGMKKLPGKGARPRNDPSFPVIVRRK